MIQGKYFLSIMSVHLFYLFPQKFYSFFGSERTVRNKPILVMFSGFSKNPKIQIASSTHTTTYSLESLGKVQAKGHKSKILHYQYLFIFLYRLGHSDMFCTL